MRKPFLLFLIPLLAWSVASYANKWADIAARAESHIKFYVDHAESDPQRALDSLAWAFKNTNQFANNRLSRKWHILGCCLSVRVIDQCLHGQMDYPWPDLDDDEARSFMIHTAGGYSGSSDVRSYTAALLAVWARAQGEVKEYVRPSEYCYALFDLQRLKERALTSEPDLLPAQHLLGISDLSGATKRLEEDIQKRIDSLTAEEWEDVARLNAYRLYRLERGRTNSYYERALGMAFDYGRRRGSKDIDALEAAYRDLKNKNADDAELQRTANLYKQSAQKGGVLGTVRYAQLLMEGKRVKNDDAEAFRLLFQPHIRHHYKFAMLGGGLALGQLYEQGRGVRKNLEAAHFWYRWSSEKCMDSFVEFIDANDSHFWHISPLDYYRVSMADNIEFVGNVGGSKYQKESYERYVLLDDVIDRSLVKPQK